MARDGPARLLVATMILGALSGCVSGDPEGPADAVFLLEYQIVDLAPDDETRYADAGRHCGDASRDGDTLTIGLWPDETRPEGTLLTVFPQLPETWNRGFNDEPFKTTLPAVIDPQVKGDNTTLGRLAWDTADQTLRRDGDAVALPHSWTITGADRAWRADLTLSTWDGDVTFQRYHGLCD